MDQQNDQVQNDQQNATPMPEEQEAGMAANPEETTESNPEQAA